MTREGLLALASFLSIPLALGCSSGSTTQPSNDVVGSGGDASNGSGGLSPSGGSSASGSASSTGGSVSSGGSASGGSSSGGGPGSLGCGTSSELSSGKLSLEVGGVTRDYEIDVPEDYDPSKPYPLVFAWHWLGGNYQDVVNGSWASDGPYYGLKERADDKMIFVAPNGTLQSFNGSEQRGWWNNGDSDFAFTEAILENLKGKLCIDEERIFSVGFSFGGMFSYALGCKMADVFRAIAPMSGSFTAGCAEGSLPVAMWSAHGVNDKVVDIGGGRTARDEFVERNGCSSTTEATDPSPCVTYDECSAGYPVTWCEWNGEHIPPSFAPDAIYDFFTQF